MCVAFLLLIQAENQKDHLNVLASVARQLRSHEVLMNKSFPL